MKIAYMHPRGTVSIVHAAPRDSIEFALRRKFKDDAEYRAFVYQKSIPAEATLVHELPTDWVPPEGSFRNAWVTDGKQVSVHMEKARAIHRERIRAARDPLLADLDVTYLRALEAGSDVKAAVVAARKQALRDAPADPAIDAVQTPEELKLVWPAILM